MSFGHRGRRTVRCAVKYLWEVSSPGSGSGRYKFGLLEKEVACYSIALENPSFLSTQVQ